MTRLFRISSLALILMVPMLAAARGDLIIIGGGFSYNNNEVWNRIESSRLAGKPIGVFGTASSTPQSTGQGVASDFNNKYGAGTAIYLDVTETNGAADTQTMADLALTCGGFYFTGGDQRRVADAFYKGDGSNTLTLDAVLSVLEAGGCIAGSSAGAAIMSDPMISGGYSDDALLYGAFPEGSSQDGVYLDDGLGFLSGVMTDQHHLSRGRLGRLIIATREAGFDYGVGINDDTAIHVDGETMTAEVIGGFGALFVDVSQMETTPGPVHTGILLHYLDYGDHVNLETGEVTVNETRTLITNPAVQSRTISSDDIWDDYEVWRLLTELVETSDTNMARGEDARALPDRPYRDVLFRKTPETQGYRGTARPYGQSRAVYTVLNIEVAAVAPGDPFPASAAADIWILE